MLRTMISILLLSATFACHAGDYGSLCQNLKAQVNNKSRMPSESVTGRVTVKAILTIYSAPDEHCAAKRVPVRIGGLLQVYESYHGWVFITYIGKENADTGREDEPSEGWVPKDSLDEVAGTAPAK